MKHLIFFLLILGISSCSEKIVQLPETHNKEITEILDVSPAYIFYNEAQGSAEFNRKNLISTTNWLVNVDKRLTLEQAMPHIMYLQDKRRKAGMHKNDAARNYFSCSNPEIQNLTFIDFTEITYMMEKPSETDSDSLSLRVKINNAQTLIDFTDSIKALPQKNIKKVLHLEFDKNLTFQGYIDCKSKLLELDGTSIAVSNTEFIHN